ncbi:hypothetical protein GCM10011490_28520 [Pseudoclavibacter endophyticus]|nr:hypothetical protein GCM10011490_28520 [Pseudoclavibacter endophyticus]
MRAPRSASARAAVAESWCTVTARASATGNRHEPQADAESRVLKQRGQRWGSVNSLSDAGNRIGAGGRTGEFETCAFEAGMSILSSRTSQG